MTRTAVDTLLPNLVKSIKSPHFLACSCSSRIDTNARGRSGSLSLVLQWEDCTLADTHVGFVLMKKVTSRTNLGTQKYLCVWKTWSVSRDADNPKTESLR